MSNFRHFSIRAQLSVPSLGGATPTFRRQIIRENGSDLITNKILHVLDKINFDHNNNIFIRITHKTLVNTERFHLIQITNKSTGKITSKYKCKQTIHRMTLTFLYIFIFI